MTREEAFVALFDHEMVQYAMNPEDQPGTELVERIRDGSLEYTSRAALEASEDGELDEDQNSIWNTDEYPIDFAEGVRHKIYEEPTSSKGAVTGTFDWARRQYESGKTVQVTKKGGDDPKHYEYRPSQGRPWDDIVFWGWEVAATTWRTVW